MKATPMPRLLKTLAMAGALAAALVAAQAQEAVIRKNLAERLPNLPKIDEVSKTPIPGLYEVRIGVEILYSDEQGNHILQGNLIDTRSRTDLTEARINKLTAIDFAELPLKDAITIRQGTGARRMAVFVDPNCGYCKRFERDLATLKDVTIYAFLYPILGADSNAKSKDIWCATDPAKTWRAWMIDGTLPPKTMGAKCDAQALARNLELGRKYRIQGTPAVVFEDGSRLPGAVPMEQVEKGLAQAAKRG
jgi:thiol:disulfide interchange protein DsbC